MIAGILQDTMRGLIGESAIAYALAAIGLNIHFGYAGLLNFGQAAFMAAGAYGLSVTVITFGWSFWAGVAFGIAVLPVLLALVLGIPTLRLRADYLAIVTIAVAEIVRLVARSPRWDWLTGSSDGLTAFANRFYDFSPFDERKRYLFDLFLGNQMWIVLVGWIAVALVLLFTYLLVNSPWGRVLKAIREDEDAARSLGKNAYSYKMQALIIGGVIGAMGGMVRAIALQSAQPDNFVTDVTFFAWVAVIVGGAGRVFGPVIGSMIFWGLTTFTESALRTLVDKGTIPENIMVGTQVGQVRFMLTGLGLVLLASFRPQGIFGNREEMALE